MSLKEVLVVVSFIANIFGHIRAPNEIIHPIESSGRISGGENAQLGEFPFMVSLRYGSFHICGGTILSRSIVLTSAHCILGFREKDLTVTAGSTTVPTAGKSSNEQTRHIAEMSIHPKFRFNDGASTSVPFYIDHDYGLINLSEPFVFGNNVNKVRLNFFAQTVAKEVTVIGWGCSQHACANLPRNLQKVNLVLTNWNLCMESYKNNGVDLSKNFICASANSGKSGACLGDSGGPILLNGQQIGITSFSTNCGIESPFPTVFSSTFSASKYLKFNRHVSVKGGLHSDETEEEYYSNSTELV